MSLTTGKLGLAFGAFALMYATHPQLAYGEDPRPFRAAAVRYDSRGVRLALGNENGSITVYDTESKQPLWNKPPTNVKIYALYFRAGDTQLVVIEVEGNIKVYAAQSGRLLRDFNVGLLNRDAKIKTAGIDPSGRILAITGTLSCTITFLDLDVAIDREKANKLNLNGTINPSGAHLGNLYVEAEPDDTVTDLRFNADSTYIAATTEKGYLIVWKFMPEDLANGRLTRLSQVEPYIRKVVLRGKFFRGLSGLAISNKRALTISNSSKYGQMQLWDIENGEMIQYEKDVDSSIPSRIVFNRSGQIAVSTSDMSYRLWAVNDNELKLLCRVYFADDHGYVYFPRNAVDFSPTQNVVALGYLSNVYLLDLSSLQIVQRFGNADGKLEVFPPQKP